MESTSIARNCPVPFASNSTNLGMHNANGGVRDARIADSGGCSEPPDPPASNLPGDTRVNEMLNGPDGYSLRFASNSRNRWKGKLTSIFVALNFRLCGCFPPAENCHCRRSEQLWFSHQEYRQSGHPADSNKGPTSPTRPPLAVPSPR